MNDATIDYAKNVIAIADDEKDFATTDDGYLVYWPKRTRGYITAAELRILADEIDRRNAKWDAELKTHLSPPASPPTTSPPG